MINFNFNLSNPWSNRWDMLWTQHQFLSANKAVEFNVYRTNSLITVDFGLSFRTDHAGVRLMLGVFGYQAELHFYDTRHWDSDRGTWVNYNKEQHGQSDGLF
jgi:hypothetical protein